VQFEVFDRTEHGAAVRAPVGPVVRVNGAGRLLFNTPAWDFLVLQVDKSGLALLFDTESRIAAVRPAGEQLKERPGARWKPEVLRSIDWPRAVPATEFVDYYAIRVGVYAAKPLRGPGPRMLTFEAGQPRGEAGGPEGG
jgi:hypothetical protein